MTINDQPIYVTDLDGTLLQDDATLSPYAHKKLTQLINAGVNFTVASARAIPSLQQVLRRLPLKLPVIGINGAFITDFKTGEHLFINAVDKDLVYDLQRIITGYNCSPLISSFDGERDRLYYHHIINDGMQWYYDDRLNAKDPRLTHLKRLRDCLDDQVVALTVINTRQALKNLANRMMAEYLDRLEMHFFENMYSPPWHWLTIHDRAACKSRAIPQLLKAKKLKLKNLTVFGDELNDINMFKAAPTAIAVQNATEKIKSLATKTIGPNTDDAVVKYIIKQNPQTGVEI